MGFGTKKFHTWFKSNPAPKYLRAYMRGYRVQYTDAEAFANDENRQALHFYFIRAVPLDEIEDRVPWSEERIERINEWASEDTLSRVPIDRYGTNSCFLPTGHIPHLYRSLTKENWGNPPKYHVGDGIHRIHAAKKASLPYILADILESFNIGKEEMVNGNSINGEKKELEYSCKFCKEPIDPEFFIHHWFEEHDFEEFINKKILDKVKNQAVSKKNLCPSCNNNKTQLVYYFNERKRKGPLNYKGKFLCLSCTNEWVGSLHEDFWLFEMSHLRSK